MKAARFLDRQMGMPAYRLRRLSLTNYRNYRSQRLDLSGQPVIITGANGSGKTNILEAISLLAPGRGLRRAHLSDVQNNRDTAAWAIAAELDAPGGFTTISTGADPSDPDRDGRLVRIDGKPAKNQAQLAEAVSMVWLTPEMDRVLVEGAAARRKLLDRLVFGFDPAHAGRVNRYENTLRERMRLLRDNIMDTAWLNTLEDELARTGVAIAVARRQMVIELTHALEAMAMDQIFARPQLALAGLAEDLLATQAALLVEDVLRARLAASRAEDQRLGSTAVGPHRSDLLVRHAAKGIAAEACSTGEQKALLIRLMLGYVRLLADWRQQLPLLLLDDIVSHLDDKRRQALLNHVMQSGSQTWLTGTDADVFRHMSAQAQHFVVQNDVISAATGRPAV